MALLLTLWRFYDILIVSARESYPKGETLIAMPIHTIKANIQGVRSCQEQSIKKNLFKNGFGKKLILKVKMNVGNGKDVKPNTISDIYLRKSWKHI